jgi:phosphoenolpyruvate carboxykinase (ATP)
MITTFAHSSNQNNMSSSTIMESPIKSLETLGLNNLVNVHYQATPQALIDATIQRKEGVLNDTGALVINTGEFTGRSPKDKFIVQDDITNDTINWNNFNIPIEG